MKGIIIILCAVFMFSYYNKTHAQIITTIAGNGTLGYSGDGMPATVAQVASGKTCLDGYGNIYIADVGGIRKIDTAGIIWTVAGTGIAGHSGDGGPATAAQIDLNFITCDGLGNLYFSELAHYVRKIDVSGIISTIGGTGVLGYSGDGAAATLAQVYQPAGIVVDMAGNVIVADLANKRIRKISTSGIITTIAGDGICGFSGDGGPATAAQLCGTNGLAIDAVGNLYLCEYTNQRVRRIDASGIITTVAGSGPTGIGVGTYAGDGGAATAARLNRPNDVAVDGNGNIYIADRQNHRIRKVNTAGIISTYAGTGTASYSGDGAPATAAELNTPSTVSATKCNNNVYVSDALNYRIRVAQANNGPAFVNGAVQDVTICMDSVLSLNALLAATDADAGQSVGWAVAMPPAHGVTAATYATTSTGSVLMPTGTTYTPATGYTGTDSFSVKVKDCGNLSGVTMFRITVNNCALGIGSRASSKGLEVWPNPSKGAFTVNIAAATKDEAHIVITDVLGRTVKELNTTTNTATSVQLNEAAGNYFIRATTKSGSYEQMVTVR